MRVSLQFMMNGYLFIHLKWLNKIVKLERLESMKKRIQEVMMTLSNLRKEKLVFMSCQDNSNASQENICNS